MKRQILSLITIVFLFTSCGENFLETFPSNAISSEIAISNTNDLKNAVNGMYDLLSSYGYYGGTAFYYGDVKGDDIQSRAQTGRDSYKCYMYSHAANNMGAGYLWGRPWYTIRQACNIIEAIDNEKIKDGTEAQINDYKGQAIAIRAMVHFDLVKYFGYPYAKDNGASLGVPIVDHVLKLDENPNRSTVAQCYEFITKELETAIPLISTEKNNGRINRYAARALLARAYLYCGKNKEAFETAQELIEEIKNNGQYRLHTNSEYISSWDLEHKFNNESLFEIANLSDDNEGKNSLAYYYHWWGYAEFIATTSFVNELLSDPDDVRCDLLQKRTQNNTDKWWLRKYPGTANNVPSYENNYIVLRLSEVYLIAAEAATKLGGTYTPQGLEYLNDIVSRANPAKSVSTSEFNLDRVLLERRKELVGEGHRFFDLLRNGKTIVRKGGLHLPNAPEEIDWNYERCVLPIPVAQFKLRPDMEQNPGYARE